MAGQIVPLSALPNQSTRVTVTVNGQSVTLNLFLRYNTIAGFWTMDIFNLQGSALVYGVPLLTGYYPAANILAPYAWLGIGSAFIISQGSALDYPDNTTLGSAFQLLWDSN